MKYEVPIVYKGQATYIVEAENEEQAMELADARFKRGDDGDLPASDYETIENYGLVLPMPAQFIPQPDNEDGQSILAMLRDPRLGIQ